MESFIDAGPSKILCYYRRGSVYLLCNEMFIVRSMTVWDRATGFLLEKRWQSIFLGFGDASLSTVSVRIIKTNMWNIDATQSNWSQWLPWAAIGIVSSVVVAAITLWNYKNRKKEKDKNSCSGMHGSATSSAKLHSTWEGGHVV
jgi:hypothetical protein